MQKTVLIADDDHFTCELLRYVVESQGLRALTCQDGQELLVTLRSEMVHIIFLDALMPRMNGFEALRKLDLEERTRVIPKILMTGIYRSDQIREYLPSGNLIKKILYKPIALDQFQSLLEENLSIRFTSQVFFPDPIKRKPGFDKRIVSNLPTVDKCDSGKRLLVVPLNGTLGQFRFGQLLQFVTHSGGSWHIDIASSSVSGGVAITDGRITAYWSSTESDYQELSFKDRMSRFCVGIFKRTSSDGHRWLTGPSASVFTGFLYRMTTALDGRYTLSRSTEESETAKKINPISFQQIMDEMMGSHFCPALIHTHLPLTGCNIKVSPHCIPLPVGIELTDQQKKLIYLIERTTAIQDILRQREEGSSETLQSIFSLWLAGIVEIQRTIQVKQSLSPTRSKLRPVEPVPDSNQPIGVEESTATPVAETSKVDSPTDRVRPVSRKDKDILHLFHLGLRAQYYEFLGVNPKCTDEELVQVLKQVKSHFIESPEIMKLPAESVRRFQSLNMFVKCAISMLGKPKSRSRYDASLAEESVERREALSKQHYDIGIMYLAEQNLSRGAAELCLAIRLNPAREEAYLQLLHALVQEPDGFEIVFDVAQDAVDRFPNQIEFRLVLGQCFKEIGQMEKATAEFLKVLDMDPENAEAMQHLLSVPGQNADLGYIIE